MTRKSSPNASKNYQTTLQPIFGWLLLVSVVSLSGCSVFSPRAGAMQEFEDARRGIENPVGVFRPEGVSAEKSDRLDLLERVGLRSGRRKNIDIARDHYKAGDAEFESAKALEGKERASAFRKAAGKYELAAENWQSSGLEQDALLMAAEARFFAEDYYQAEQLYTKILKEYPRNPYLDHIDSRRFEIADYWLKYQAHSQRPFVFVNFTNNRLPWNDTGGHGKRVLEKMRLDNPTGKVSDDATMRLAMEDFQQGKFEDAADTFADLRMTYPDSEHQFNAQFLELQSLLESYQGPKYSSIPVTEAQKRVEQLVKQFPQEAASREEEIKAAYARVRYLMAERIWTQGEYRRGRAENDSAKFHYNRLLEKYPDTPFADRASERMEELRDKPDQPPQRFKALIWAFGASNDDRPWKNDQ